MQTLRNALEQSEKDGRAIGHFNVADLVRVRFGRRYNAPLVSMSLVAMTVFLVDGGVQPGQDARIDRGQTDQPIVL
jgi:hypothetical protein